MPPICGGLMHAQPNVSVDSWNGPVCPTHGRYLGICGGCFPGITHRPYSTFLPTGWFGSLTEQDFLKPAKLHDEGAGL